MQKKAFNGYYSIILGSMSSCFRKARLMPLEDLKCQDPSFSAIADDLKGFYKSMVILNDNFLEAEHKMSQNELNCINIYTILLERLGKAIDIEDIDTMTEVIAILAEEPYI